MIAKFIDIDSGLKDQIASWRPPAKLKFGWIKTPIMAMSHYRDGSWSEPTIGPYKDLSLDPSAKCLHYGQSIFEGMKAYKSADSIPMLFRPQKNAQRINISAERMAMPQLPESIFMACVENMTYHLANMIPTGHGESLYIRPYMFATEPGLGLAIAHEYCFMVIASPSGAYFTADKVRVIINREEARAARGGTGAAKACGNYAASLRSSFMAKKKGFHQTLWLDPVEKRYVDEFSGMNFFAVINDELFTPSLTDSILAGITRDSVLELATAWNIPTHETKININEILKRIKSGECTEIFACGTAAVITAISELSDMNGDIYILKESNGPVCSKLRERLMNIQIGKTPGPKDWVYEVIR